MGMFQGSSWQPFVGVIFLLSIATLSCVLTISGAVKTLPHIAKGHASKCVKMAQQTAQRVTATVDVSTRQSPLDHWACMRILAKHCLVILPASEVGAAFSLCGLCRCPPLCGTISHQDGMSETTLIGSTNGEEGSRVEDPNETETSTGDVTDPTLGTLNMARDVQLAVGRIRNAARLPQHSWCRDGVLTSIRILLLFIWIPLLVVDYTVLLLVSLFKPHTWVVSAEPDVELLEVFTESKFKPRHKLDGGLLTNNSSGYAPTRGKATAP